MKLVHAMKCKVEYEIGQEVVMNVKNFTKFEGLMPYLTISGLFDEIWTVCSPEEAHGNEKS